MKNYIGTENIHNRSFTCPKCGNAGVLIPLEEPHILGVGYHELLICDECGAELLGNPNVDYKLSFMELEEEDYL